MHIFSIIILGLIWESVTLLIVSLAGILLTYNLRTNIFKNFFIIIFLIFLIFLLNENFQFISDRINFSTDTKNLSILTFLSGYERAYLSIIENNGLGMGFQQMGILGPIGEFQEKIKYLMGGYMNFYDGSSLAPKIIYELGIVGIFLIIIYIYYFFKNLKKLLNNKFKSNQELFFSMVFFSIIIALFVRAASYFTPSMFIFAVSLVGMNRLRK